MPEARLVLEFVAALAWPVTIGIALWILRPPKEGR
jgi:hypothetical protein